MKWFPNTQDAYEDVQRESALPVPQYDALPDKPKKASHTRLSATFTEARPWNFMSASQVSDRSSSSSRKRRSLFGNRSSTTSSGTLASETPLDIPLPKETSTAHSSARRISGLGELRPASLAGSNSRTSTSGLENWRSSIFSRKRSSRINEIDESFTEPTPAHRGRKETSTRSSMDFWSRGSESEDAFYKNLMKNSISSPFNFQHVTHTPKDHLPVIDSVTDRELTSEFWAASAYQAPQRQLHGIAAQNIERDPCESKLGAQRHNDAEASNLTQSRYSPVASVATDPIDHDSLNRTPSDAESITPVNEIRRPTMPLQGLSSAERLATIGVEQREPPAMLHPAFRSQTSGSIDHRQQIHGPVYELPAMNLDSVPEEHETASPPRPRPGRFNTEGSPRLLPATLMQQTLPPAKMARPTTFTPFPIGNAFAQAYGGFGAEVAPATEHTPSSCEDSIASLTSADTWETEVDLLYLVEAESTCDFDWTSIKSSRKGSDGSQHRRNSDTASSFRTTSVRDDTSTRPTSQRTSIKSYHDDGAFTGFDGASTFSASLLQKFGGAAKRHSAVSVGNVELSTIPELGREVTTSSHSSSSETIFARPTVKHGRSVSYSGQRPEAPKRPARWSIASPLCLPEDAKRRVPNFSRKPKVQDAEQMPFSAPLFPPPALPLPEIPKNQVTGLISPPLSPPTLYSSDFDSLRRPSSSQDRALLQAAGRIVQRGRSGRPATPSRLSHVQNAKQAFSRTISEPILEVPRTEVAHFGLMTFPTPPNSPPRPQHDEAYPAWI